MNQDVDVSMDGVDPDDNANQRLASERRHVSWQARQLIQDKADLESMSEADKNRYAAPLPTYNFIKRR